MREATTGTGDGVDDIGTELGESDGLVRDSEGKAAVRDFNVALHTVTNDGTSSRDEGLLVSSREVQDVFADDPLQGSDAELQVCAGTLSCEPVQKVECHGDPPVEYSNQANLFRVGVG